MKNNELLEPGEYKKYKDIWYCVPPNCPRTFMGNLGNHDIVENDDGTITVSPSILIGSDDRRWHGYLKNGIWDRLPDSNIG